MHFDQVPHLYNTCHTEAKEHQWVEKARFFLRAGGPYDLCENPNGNRGKDVDVEGFIRQQPGYDEAWNTNPGFYCSPEGSLAGFSITRHGAYGSAGIERYSWFEIAYPPMAGSLRLRSVLVSDLLSDGIRISYPYTACMVLEGKMSDLNWEKYDVVKSQRMVDDYYKPLWQESCENSENSESDSTHGSADSSEYEADRYHGEED